MTDKRVKISSIVKNQLPSFIREEYPLLSEFLSQYYISLETKGAANDIIKNIDQYIKVDSVTNIQDSTTLTQLVDYTDTTINVLSTQGFPDSYGLIRINQEIITYESKTDTQFIGCTRGFSGVTSYKNSNNPDQLVFSQSEIDTYSFGSVVENLSILFLKEFLQKIKKQFSPGFENREISSNLNQNIFIKQSQDFYRTKGTDDSFKILFNVLYGEPCEVIKPRDYLFTPSGSSYEVSKKIVIEPITGDPLNLVNLTIKQDKDDYFEKAVASVKDVKKIVKENKEYYILSLDYNSYNEYNSVFGNFSVHPKTKLLESVSTSFGTEFILTVDSTIGFPNSGTLEVILDNGVEYTISYENKNINQFLNCVSPNEFVIPENVEIRLRSYAYYSDPINPANDITFRVCSILSNVQIVDDNNLFERDDVNRIKCLGENSTSIRDNVWLFNLPVSYDVKTIDIRDQNNFSYAVTTYDDNIFLKDDFISVILRGGSEVLGKVSVVNNKKSFTIKDTGKLDISKVQKIKRNISKTNFSSLTSYISNVQNVYTDYTSTLVCSNSLPDYENLTDIQNYNNYSVYINGSINGENITAVNHGFNTGDAVYYSFTSSDSKYNISSGNYFVNVVGENIINLAKSRTDIFKKKFIKLVGNPINNNTNRLDKLELYNKSLKPQKIVRKISNPVNTSNRYLTSPGFTGILVNGVEILNYKSKDFLYHGGIEEVEVLSSGQGYDLINPPTLLVKDEVGTGCSVFCEVEGYLNKIDIIDPGFDYTEKPIITITGGNGYGATAEANLVDFEHSVIFNSSSSASLVNLVDNTIAFSTYHKFRNAEEVVYETDNQNGISGLTTSATYYISVKDDYTVKIHKNFEDASSGINTVNIISYGVGNHRLKSKKLKKKLGSISISNPGIFYKNRKISVDYTGINTFSNTIIAKSHRYSNGDIISYSYSGSPIGGLTTSLYYVTKVNEDEFKLSSIGVGITNKDFYYLTQQYLNFSSQGSGEHIFNHEPISVSIKGKTGVSTSTNIKTEAILQPVFRGSIKTVFIKDSGIGYGSSIINYNRQPELILLKGTDATVVPIISNGSIKEVIVTNGGINYTEIPDLEISGSGYGSILAPIIKNGSLIDVKVIHGGLNYSEDTVISVVSRGYGAQFNTKIKSWNVNLVEKLISSKKISSDDGILVNTVKDENEIQYAHLYAPRLLRKKVLASKVVDGETVYSPDLIVSENNSELTSVSHSPIIGWAYDGNPIYGPYGYSSPNGKGIIREMKSGYEKISVKDASKTRPSTDIFPLGFLVEDYVFTGSGDLDERNGRFCVTPDYPNGVYAYFSTIENIVSSEVQFNKFKKPSFPYFIGNEYKSTPIEFNFDYKSNQTDFDLSKTDFIRNTTFYNLTKNNSNYPYLIDKKYVKLGSSKVKNSSVGSIESIGILTGGLNYRVGESVLFNNTNTEGENAYALVSSIKGRQINNIVTNSKSLKNVEFYSTSLNSVVGFCTTPHDLESGTIINIPEIDAKRELTKNRYRVGVKSEFFYLSNAIGNASVTGIVTYLPITGNINFLTIRENDVLGIGTEKIKILNVEKEASRIRVIREYDGSVSSAHTAYTKIVENSRKIILTGEVSNLKSSKFNKEIYFNPKESIGVGIGTTIVFSNPGVGITQIFVAEKSFYIPSHNLNTGDKLIYNSNGGSPIKVSTSTTSFVLQDNQTLYASRFSDNFIGISTIKVGLGSTGTFVGIGTTNLDSVLSIVQVGTGNYHSFKTNYEEVSKFTVNSNIVTVSTASTHGLNDTDLIYLKSFPSISTTVYIQYNDYNRRLIINPKTFISSGVNTTTSELTINNHNYYTGKKLIHISDSPAGGLVNNKIYFAVSIDENTFKLAESHYDATKAVPNTVGITSTSSGTLFEVNPEIKLIRNQEVVFDLSHSSLSYTDQSTVYSAFDFNLYTDKLYKNKVESVNFVKTGQIGISSDAKATLTISNSLPNTLYYSLDPKKLNNSEIKKQIIKDSENNSKSSTLTLSLSGYNGVYDTVGVGSTTFKFYLIDKPESLSYTKNQGIFDYVTNSPSSFGAVDKIDLISGGRGYKTLPDISIGSLSGSEASLIPNSSLIGKIKNIEIEDFGFDYPSDTTLKPTGKLPDIIKLSPLYTFESIGISSVGKYYTKAPNLIIIDSFSKKIVDDIDLEYVLENSEINIKKNTYGLFTENVKIIPVNNSNGIGINSISYDSSTKNVIVGLAATYSAGEVFPFAIGDKILIENTSVGLNTLGKGYNSENYNFSLFTVTQINPQLGGSGASITYNLSDYLNSNEDPGNFDVTRSSGTVVPEKYFPIFTPIFKKNNFIVGEDIFTNTAVGKVKTWNPFNGIAKIESFDTFIAGQVVKGKISNSQAIIDNVTTTRSIYNLGSTIETIDGWKNEFGFLNNDFQRIQDSDYFQKLSYSIKSKVPFEKWNDPVSTLNHTLGFKKFSDLIIESIPTSDDNEFVGIKTDQDGGDFSSIAEITGIVDLNCFYDFDLVTENNLSIDSNIISDQVFFKSQVLQDYFESIGNRVIEIDDISNQFSDLPRSTNFIDVSSFVILDKIRYNKNLILVKDRRFTNERQVCLFSLLQDGSVGYFSEYAKNYTVSDMGTFDFSIFGFEGQILFYPTKYERNNFDISVISYNLKDVFSGIGSSTIGDIVEFKSNVTNIASGSSSEISLIGISSSFRSSKFLVSIASTDGSYYEVNEISTVHDNSEVYLVEYGRLNDSITASSGVGLGTYFADISGSTVNLKFKPSVSVGASFNCTTLAISIGNTTSTSIGTTSFFSNGAIESNYKIINSSASPVATGIVSYSLSKYEGGYFIASVEDKTNNKYQISELILVNDNSNVNIIEYGIVETDSSLGSFSANVNGANVELKFTPTENIDVEVRIFANTIGPKDLSISSNIIDLNSSYFGSDFGVYVGTSNDIKKDFDLLHNGETIFTRSFRGDLNTVVSISDDTVLIPNHLFVTGEELKYKNSSIGSTETTNSIGIALTTIPGIGVTDKLPTTVYAIKVNESSIRLASSAENALTTNPVYLNLSSVGIGSIHSFTGKNQNKRVLVSIDNVIQSPIVSSAITTTLLSNILITEDLLPLSNVTSFFGGDLIKINNEIMRVISVGVGSTNVISVQRPWLGTELESHYINDTVVKISGNFNIVDNTIYFAEAPHGELPPSSPTNPPLERDYSGVSTHSTFNGRMFMRSSAIGSTEDPYSKNYIFDDISASFTGISSEFTLKVDGENVSGISSSNAIILINQIAQLPKRETIPVSISGDFSLDENLGITTISFTGISTYPQDSTDIQSSNVPVGGIILSVGSTSGFGYQPLVAAGGTAIVSGLGTISSISIGNSGSGYRSGIQTVVNVAVATSSIGTPNIEFIGTASIIGGHVVSIAITNPGTGYTSTNPPIVIFDDPLSYSNVPLIYYSNSGIGTGAVVDIVVSQNSKVINFEFKNYGYAYKAGEVLTVEIGGTTGIPTTSLPNFEEFKISIDKTFEDSFSGWSFGDLEVLDDFSDLFDGFRKSFPIKFNNQFKTIRSKKGSNIEVASTLIIFINDILQVPNQSYIFDGGSVIEFTEAPKVGDSCKILFYKGTGSVDVLNVDVLETIKVGDDITLNSDTYFYNENERIVNEIQSSNVLKSNAHRDVGISTDETFVKSITWCKQTEDRFINGKPITKDRIWYEPNINPFAYLIQPVTESSTSLYVDTLRPFFNILTENDSFQNKISIVSQDSKVSASATSLVSSSGIITSVTILDGGSGYDTEPNIIFGSPVGLGTTQRASGISSIVGGSVSSIQITNGGIGYTSTNPPQILIEPPKSTLEVVSINSYSGDSGVIVGFGTTSISNIDKIIFDLHIPFDSYLRDISVVGTAITLSSVNVGDYFIVYNSNVGVATTSINSRNISNEVIAVGKSYVDNVYQVDSVSDIKYQVVGIGTTTFRRVYARISGISTLTFDKTNPKFDSTIYTFDSLGFVSEGYSGIITSTNYFGNYSWGKVNLSSRPNPNQFNFYGNNGISGITTSAIVRRSSRFRI